MQKKHILTGVLLLTATFGFSASSHPVNFHNDRKDTAISIQYLTGHKYSKCVSYVRPPTLMVNPGQVQTSTFRDKDHLSCNGIDKYASWLIRTVDDASAIVTLRHDRTGDWVTYIEINGHIVNNGDTVPINGGKYALRVDNNENIVFY
ncbi:hypothetical protein [Cysteiniphilum sp. QT6929]|uniref:hypothetical protein n=1 Tax=Cysteiniphilum sp. QT6929 TaxID=2975055 RepID=UPI0024B32821|nr:hypothetical protein [Cysteiniphilum sp. QT6929]WHN66307.1 hypothetical protein NYP54_03495 [Cysteiniphilum sp. QT6929]